MDRLEAMSFFVAAADTGSFSAVSRELSIPLPTISRKVAELESHLNARLLIRSTRKLSLTEAGESYLAVCRAVLEQVADAERAASGEYSTPRGDITLTAPVGLGTQHLLPIVNEFLAMYPEIDVRVVLADRTMHLIDERIDVAVRVGQLPDSSLVATSVGTVFRVLAGSPDYFAGAGKPKTPDELKERACINFEALTPANIWTFATSRGEKATYSVNIHPRLSVNAAQAAIDSAINGVGITHVLSYQIASAVQSGELVLVLRDFEAEQIPVSIIHTGQKLQPVKIRRFIEFAVPRLRQAFLVDDERLP